MKRLSCVIDKEIADKFENKAKSLGVKPASYLRNVIIADLKKNEDMLSLNDLQNCIIALIPAFVEAIGRVQKGTPEQRAALTKICLKIWKEHLRNEDNKTV